MIIKNIFKFVFLNLKFKKFLKNFNFNLNNLNKFKIYQIMIFILNILFLH